MVARSLSMMANPPKSFLSVPSAISSSDPEHCHSFGATLFELAFLQKHHFHPAVRQMAKDTLLLKIPLPSEQPRLLLQDYDTTLCGFNPPVPLPPARSKKEIQEDKRFIEATMDTDDMFDGDDYNDKVSSNSGSRKRDKNSGDRQINGYKRRKEK